MKFIYIDESGAPNQGDVFVMFGLMVDAYKLRKKTEDFDKLLGSIFERHDGTRNDFKTSRFINGVGGWRKVNLDERKKILRGICELAVERGNKIFGIALSITNFKGAVESGHGHPFKDNYWLASAIYTACLVQKKMQGDSRNKGFTVVIMDDNKVKMPRLSDELYSGNAWFDGLYQIRHKKDVPWKPRTKKDRFDKIINTAFAIKSDHSSLIQVADAICYVYRRHLELKSESEIKKWPEEREYYESLVRILKPVVVKLGDCPDTPSVRFFRSAKHPDWKPWSSTSTKNIIATIAHEEVAASVHHARISSPYSLSSFA